MTRERRNVRSSRVNPAPPNAMLREVDYIVGRAAQLDSGVVTLDQLVFFSSASGDAFNWTGRGCSQAERHQPVVTYRVLCFPRQTWSTNSRRSPYCPDWRLSL